MAIDKGAEETTEGNNGFVFRKATQIIKSEIDDILTHTDKINDFTTGSIARTMVEAESLEIEKLYYYTLENLKHSIDEGITSAFGFTRKSATYAYGNVLVRLSAPLTQDMVVDRGTLFYSTNPNYQQQYRTTVAYRIPKGAQSFTLAVYCTVLGTYGNIPENTIDRSTDIGELVSVTNPEAFNTGTDEENPEAAKVRFRQMIQSLSMGTNQSLVYAAESVPGVAGASLFESTYGAVVIYAHDANGDLSGDLQQAVADKLVAYKPAGIKVFVLPTHKSVVALDVEVKVNDTTLEQDSFLELVKQTLSDYINTLTVGDPLYKANIIQKVMDVSDVGVVDTKVDVKVYPDSEMLGGDLSLDDDSIINVKGVLVGQPYLRPVDVTSEETYGLLGVDNTKTKEQDGNTYKDAIANDNSESPDGNGGNEQSSNGTSSTIPSLQTGATNSLGNTYSKGIEVDDIYRTNSNEILRLALCNVHFKYNDFQEPIDSNSKNIVDKKTRTIIIKYPNGNQESNIQNTVLIGNSTYIWPQYVIPALDGYDSYVDGLKTSVVPKQTVDVNDDDNVIVNVTYQKSTLPATHKTITRTICIHDIDGNVDIIPQMVNFMRYIVTDAQGNPTSYTDWAGDGNFDEYAIPQHEGFISQIGSEDTKVVPSQHVNLNDEDTIVNVTYKQDPTTNTNTGSNGSNTNNNNIE